MTVRTTEVSEAAGELDAIMELETAGFPEVERWSRASWESELTSPAMTVLVARDERLRGVIALRLGPDVCDVDRILVHPDSRRTGIGRSLLTTGLEHAAARGVQEMILEVRAGNEPAIALYASYGFSAVTVRDDYYGPGQHAVIMNRRCGGDSDE